MAGTTGQISGDVIDAIRPDLEAFASLWSALRTNYQGTNITKTVARLLHMYQPEDGVLAYERLLRTLYVLLEDFDSDGLRLLVSMVPPPKGVSDETIKQVFHKATGFVRLNAPIFHRNNVANSENDVNSSSGTKTNSGNSDSFTTEIPRLQTVIRNTERAPEGTTILHAIVKSDTPPNSSKSPKLCPEESEVFRGFPSNEITNTQSHARNMTHFYGPSSNYGGYSHSQRYLNYGEAQREQNAGSIPPREIDPSAYRFKWLEAPMLLRQNNYDVSTGYPDLILKTSDNKFIRLPITKINRSPIGGYNSSYNNPIQSTYQAFYPNGQIHLRNNISNSNSNNADLSRKMSNHLHSKKKSSYQGSEKPDESFRGKEEGSVKSRINHVDHDYGFTMYNDFSPDKENCEIDNVDSLSNETIEKFRDTVKNSQRAIQEDIYRMDVVRCDEDIVQTTAEEINNLDAETLIASDELKRGACDFLKRAEEERSLKPPDFPRTRMLQDPENNPTSQMRSSPRLCKFERAKKCQKTSEKSEDSRNNHAEDATIPGSSEVLAASTKNSILVNNPSGNRGSRGKVGRTQAERTSQKRASSSKNSSRKCDQSSKSFGNNEEEDNKSVVSMESVIKKNGSMYQAYRKQYYDALLSIQRAKVAVANSLAISSSQTSTGYDPRVFQYLQQRQQHHHQLLLQQQQQRILMAPQHPVAPQTIAQPRFSSIRNTAGLWIHGSNDWKYSPCGQYRFPRQTYPMFSSSSCPTQAPMNTSGDSSISENCPQSSHPSQRTSKPAIKRQKLEDIIGKLKDTDDNN